MDDERRHDWHGNPLNYKITRDPSLLPKKERATSIDSERRVITQRMNAPLKEEFPGLLILWGASSIMNPTLRLVDESSGVHLVMTQTGALGMVAAAPTAVSWCGYVEVPEFSSLGLQELGDIATKLVSQAIVFPPELIAYNTRDDGVPHFGAIVESIEAAVARGSTPRENYREQNIILFLLAPQAYLESCVEDHLVYSGYVYKMLVKAGIDPIKLAARIEQRTKSQKGK